MRRGAGGRNRRRHRMTGIALPKCTLSHGPSLFPKSFVIIFPEFNGVAIRVHRLNVPCNIINMPTRLALLLDLISLPGLSVNLLQLHGSILFLLTGVQCYIYDPYNHDDFTCGAIHSQLWLAKVPGSGIIHITPARTGKWNMGSAGAHWD